METLVEKHLKGPIFYHENLKTEHGESLMIHFDEANITAAAYDIPDEPNRAGLVLGHSAELNHGPEFQDINDFVVVLNMSIEGVEFLEKCLEGIKERLKNKK